MYNVVSGKLVIFPGNSGEKPWHSGTCTQQKVGTAQIVNDRATPLGNRPRLSTYYCIFDPPLRRSLFLLNCPTVLSFYDTKPSPGLPSTSLKLHQHLNQPVPQHRCPANLFKNLFGDEKGSFLTTDRFIFPLLLHPTFLPTLNWVMIINSTILKRSEKGQLTD